MPGLSGRAGGGQGLLTRRWRAQVGDYPVCVCWHLDGSLLHVGDADGVLSTFAAGDGAIVVRVDGHAGGVLDLAPSPDGRRLSSAGQDGCVRLWEPAATAPLATLPAQAAWVEHLAWAPDGSRLAAAAGRHLHLWRADGAPAAAGEPEGSTISALAWADSGEIVTAGYSRVAFRDAGDGSVRQSLEWKGSLISLALSPNGAIIACGSQDRTVHFWRRATGEDSMMSGYPAKPAALAFDDSSTLLATAGADYVTVWSFAGGGPEGTRPGLLEGHGARITALAFASGRRRLASAAKDGSLLVWDLSPSGTGRLKGAVLVGAAVEAIAWNPRGTAIARIDAEGWIEVWDCADTE